MKKAIKDDVGQIEMADERLVDLAKGGDERSLSIIISRYEPVVKMRAKAYYLTGADRDDVVQEGMIGLYKAVKDFKEEKKVSFKVFAELCVTRQIISAIKTAARQKHMPLNSYVSLGNSVYDEENDHMLSKIYLAHENTLNPESLMINKEDSLGLERQLEQRLSSFEKEVFEGYALGKAYSEIAKELGKPAKSVDNAIQRIRRKFPKEGYGN